MSEKTEAADALYSMEEMLNAYRDQKQKDDARIAELEAALNRVYRACLGALPARIVDAHPDAPEDVEMLAALLEVERALRVDSLENPSSHE